MRSQETDSHLPLRVCTPAECVLGYGLLYSFRVFERQRGSAKFLVRVALHLDEGLPR